MGLNFAEIKFPRFPEFWKESRKSAKFNPHKNQSVEIKSPWNLIPSVTIISLKKYHVKSIDNELLG